MDVSAAPLNAQATNIATAKRQRMALFILFFVTGVALSSWVTRTPDIRDALDVSIAHMGLLMFGISSGAMLGLVSANRLIAWLSTQWVAGAGVAILALGLGIAGIGSWWQSPWVVTLGLFLMGLGMGAPEIAINVEGANVERALARPVLPLLHGFFSAGTVVGGSLGIGLTAIEFPSAWHFIMIAILAMPAVAYATVQLPANHGETPSSAGNATTEHHSVLNDPRLWLIGIICLAMALAEGSANDWLPLLMVDTHGFQAATSSFIFTGFAAGMMLGRFLGTPLIDRLGRAPVLACSALSCALGIALAIFSPLEWLTILSVLFWGMGASLGFPVAISAAGDSGPHSQRRVSLVAMIGYLAFLAGPPLLGFIGDHHGLGNALLLVLAMVILAACLAPATRAPSSAKDQ